MAQQYFTVTTPVEGKDGVTRFQRCGVAFPGKDGSKVVMNIRLDSLPLNGELVLFEPRSGDEDDTGGDA